MLTLVSAFLPSELKRRIKARLGVPDIESALERLRSNGFAPRAAIDVGAYEGEWASMCRRVWPSCQVLMIEPQAGKRPTLERIASRPGVGVVVQTALLGASPRDAVTFYVNETVSSVLPESDSSSGRPMRAVMTTLDDVVTSSGLAAPNLIKLDVQGYELEVLRGGARSLAAAEAVLIEINLLDINEGAPLLAEVVAFMANHGFRAYDICSLTRRPLDRALWQTDFIFVRASSALFSSKRWG